MAEDFKKFQDGKQRILDKNYDKYAKDMINQLKKEYRKTSADIEIEIRRWYDRMDKIKKANPDFRFSELKQLEDLNKQIDLILDALTEVETEIMENGMKKLFVTDYIDFNELNKKYLDMDLHTPTPEFNQLPQVQRLEYLLHSPSTTISDFTLQSAKSVAEKTLAQVISSQIIDKVIDEFELSWFYDGTSGRWFNVRVEERLMKCGISLKDEIRKGVIRGDGVNGLVGKLEKTLDISYKHATTMVRTELATVENEAVIHNAKKLGYDALEFATMKDDKVCKLCKSMEGTVVPLDARGGDYVMQYIQVLKHQEKQMNISKRLKKNGNVKMPNGLQNRKLRNRKQKKKKRKRNKRNKVTYYLSRVFYYVNYTGDCTPLTYAGFYGGSKWKIIKYNKLKKYQNKQ